MQTNIRPKTPNQYERAELFELLPFNLLSNRFKHGLQRFSYLKGITYQALSQYYHLL